jgi:hypothetical protein
MRKSYRESKGRAIWLLKTWKGSCT